MNQLLDTLPTWLACFLFVILCLMVYFAGMRMFRRLIQKDSLRKNHDVNGIFIGLIGVLYSLVLAFVIVAVWEDYEQINSEVAREASKLNDIISHSEELPDSVGQNIRAAILNYADVVVHKEWSAMEEHRVNQLSHNALQSIRKVTFASNVTSDKEEAVFKIIHDDVTTVSDMRQERLTRNHSHVPNLVWLVLVAGSLITIFFSYFFFIEPFWLQSIIGVFLTVMIAMCLFLVYMLDHPFIGSSKISSEPFQEVILENQ